MTQILWTKKATKQLLKLPVNDAGRIKLAVDGLAEWPSVKQVKALTNREDYRLRVGDYRVFFRVDAEGNPVVITIERVERRNEHIYKQ
ncbi:MAG: type II toxin-antitoxin system RelE/ParE family toxin [Deltaproteobacteria bacterium]|nr:type II toxin-antitoxin system RelE/ParE family toxin [Deltaproteobacteria bacterium]